MKTTLTENTISGFIEVLAAKAPVPGGGGAAALAGALGAALCSMVGNYTSGKKAYADVEEDVQRMLAEAADVRRNLARLINEDADAFVPLSAAYAIPKGDPRRAVVLEQATKAAIRPPLEMMRQMCRAIELLEEMGEKGSRMLASDVACGALLSKAALESASVNVFVNTASLQDRAYASTIEAECDEMLEEYGPRAQACADGVIARIRKEA